MPLAGDERTEHTKLRGREGAHIATRRRQMQRPRTINPRQMAARAALIVNSRPQHLLKYLSLVGCETWQLQRGSPRAAAMLPAPCMVGPCPPRARRTARRDAAAR